MPSSSNLNELSQKKRSTRIGINGQHLRVKPVQDRNFNSSFYEHTWDIHRIQQAYPNSHINVRDPDKSRGLFTQQAEELLKINGSNILPKPKGMGDLELFLRQFINLLWIVLIIAAALTFISYIADPSDPSGLYCTVLLVILILVMCGISWYQEREGIKVVRAFQDLMAEKSTVIRDGKAMLILAQEVVVGDIIKIQPGMRIPADARILQCNRLKLETSSITGESEPVDYNADPVPENVNIFEALNVAFNSSLCLEGDGVAIVIRTGLNTVIGEISTLTTNQKTKGSRFEKQLSFLIWFTFIGCIIIGTFAFIIGGFVHDWQNILMLISVSYAVCSLSMVPEGLPATVTSILTVIARRMEAKNVYLKRLDIIEALGSVNIIASDKTGTITKNSMTVTKLWYYDNVISGPPYISKDRSLEQFKPPLSDIMLAMTICNKATLSGNKIFESAVIEMPDKSSTALTKTVHSLQSIHRSINKTLLPFSTFESFTPNPPILGSPSDIAMLKYANQMIDTSTIRQKYPIIFEIPFDSKRKWQLVIIRVGKTLDGMTRYKLIMKGASEILIKKCNKILDRHGQELPLDDEILKKFQKSFEDFGDLGCRVIGFVQTEFIATDIIEFSEKNENFPQNGLTLIGTCAIMDPPRDETFASIKKCKEAGIKVFMVTGDHHTTAQAIAKQIGLIEDRPNGQSDWEVVYGENLQNLTEKDWDRLISRNSLVFSRTTPEQKLLIVEQCQKRKQIIAMTGDGVNDAPALKKADIGVGMGSGSDVARQSADIILTDDNFASIVSAIQEGRLMFDNVKKMMAKVLSHMVPEVWGILPYYCFGMPIGITSLMILSIDLGTEIGPGIAMCKEPPEDNIMKRPPRRRDKIVVGKAMLLYCYGYTCHIQTLACFLAYCYIFWSYNINISDLWMSTTNNHWVAGGANFTSNGHTFSVEEQLYINRQACSAWQVSIVFGQAFHTFSTRSLRESMFKHGFFSNKAAIIAMVIELSMILAFVYLPGLNTFLGGAPIPFECWLIPAGFGIFIFAYNELRKYCIRKWPKNQIVRLFKF